MCNLSNFEIGVALLEAHKGTNKLNLISGDSKLLTQAQLRISTF